MNRLLVVADPALRGDASLAYRDGQPVLTVSPGSDPLAVGRIVIAALTVTTPIPAAPCRTVERNA
ncbi:MAG: hypothetical protein ACYCU5_16220 [Actinomycetes bacterium]